MKERRALVAKQDRTISKRRRASLLAVNLSTLYVKRKLVSSYEITLVNEIQDIYAIHPFKGYRRICHDLQDKGYRVNYKRILRLMRVIGLQAVYPKKNLSKRWQEDFDGFCLFDSPYRYRESPYYGVAFESLFG